MISNNKINKCIMSILFICFSFFGSAWAVPEKIKEEQKKTLEFSFLITDKSINMTIVGSAQFKHVITEKDGYITISIPSFVFTPSSLAHLEIHKGLVETIDIKNVSGIAMITIRTILIPDYKTFSADKGKLRTVNFVISYAIPKSNVVKRAIKTRNTYKAGVSMLTDMGIVLESTSKPAVGEKSFLPVEKMPVAEMKKGLKDNIGLIMTGERPSVEKKDIKVINFNAFPIEKRESIRISFVNKDLAEILKILASKTGKNIIVSPLIKGRKSIEFKDMTPEEAMNSLLSQTDYEIRIRKDTILAGPPEALDNILAEGRSLTGTGAALKKIFVLRKIRGERVIKMFESFFPGVSYTFYPKLNTFEINGNEGHMDNIDKFFTDVDIER